MIACVGKGGLEFIQGYVTSDTSRLRVRHDAQYGAFLTPKGRTLGEAMLVLASDADSSEPILLLDVASVHARGLLQHLSKYKLRARFTLQDWSATHAVTALLPRTPFSLTQTHTQSHTTLLQAIQGVEVPPTAAFVDPRCRRMGVRLIAPRAATVHGYVPSVSGDVYATLRTLCGLPEGGEVTDAIPLEWNLDHLHGVAFDKGCYLGQELVARAAFRGQVRKRVMPIEILPLDAPPAPVRHADPLAASRNVKLARDAAVELPFDFATPAEALSTVQAGDTLYTPAAGKGAQEGQKVGKIISVLPRSRLGMALIRLEAVAHAVPAGRSTPGEVADAHAQELEDDYTADATVAAVTALHAQCEGANMIMRAVATPTAPAGEESVAGTPVARVTPVLPMYWRNVRA